MKMAQYSKQLDFGVFAVLFIVLLSFCPSTLAHTKNRKDIPPPVDVDDFHDCFDKVYAFGDSSTDTGNCFVLGTVKAYVKQFMAKTATSFSAATGEGASQSQGHRLCNGRLVVDYLCEALGKPTLPPYKEVSANFSGGVNFAIAGSTALGNEFFSKPGKFDFSGKFNFSAKFNVSSSLMWNSVPQSYGTQINWFNKFVEEKACRGKNPQACKAHLGSALFWIGAFGLSDYARVFKHTQIASKMISHLCVGHLKKLITTVLERGAKFIVIEGLPPVGCQSLELSVCSPSDHDEMGCAKSTNQWIKAHNDLLQKTIQELRITHTETTIIYADFYSAYESILMNHKLYDFVEPFKACCGAGNGFLKFESNRLCGLPGTTTCKDPSKYMNWDGIHLTETMNRNIADLLFNRGHCKPSFQELIAKRKSAVAASV